MKHFEASTGRPACIEVTAKTVRRSQCERKIPRILRPAAAAIDFRIGGTNALLCNDCGDQPASQPTIDAVLPRCAALPLQLHGASMQCTLSWTSCTASGPRSMLLWLWAMGIRYLTLEPICCEGICCEAVVKYCVYCSSGFEFKTCYRGLYSHTAKASVVWLSVVQPYTTTVRNVLSCTFQHSLSAFPFK